ncbi:MAG: VanZ family protein [Eubacterium sp.]|nr:VanZ family protein [Eubacterium sp.]
MKESTKTKLQESFFGIAFILSCFTMNSDNLGGYWESNGMPKIMLRYLLIFVFLTFLTIINKTNFSFISKFVKYTLFGITPLVIFDYYVTEFSGGQFLYRVWWISYIIIAAATVFSVATIIKPKEYKCFYYEFWQGFLPIYLFTLFICFLRTPFTSLTTNYIIGNGTLLMLKAIIRNPHIDFEPYLIFFGNVIIFIPLPFILSAFLKKIKPYQLVLIGLITPFIVEGYQYFLKCGDVDIDDIILNWLGYFIGMGIYLIIKKRLLTKSE